MRGITRIFLGPLQDCICVSRLGRQAIVYFSHFSTTTIFLALRSSIDQIRMSPDLISNSLTTSSGIVERRDFEFVAALVTFESDGIAYSIRITKITIYTRLIMTTYLANMVELVIIVILITSITI